LVGCRLIGGIAIEEMVADGRHRNDRLLAVPPLRHRDRPPYELSDVPSAQLTDIEDFLVGYQAADGKDAKVKARLDKAEAESIVREAAHA
jgi:inorganic pyrophosphatase